MPDPRGPTWGSREDADRSDGVAPPQSSGARMASLSNPGAIRACLGELCSYLGRRRGAREDAVVTACAVLFEPSGPHLSSGCLRGASCSWRSRGRGASGARPGAPGAIVAPAKTSSPSERRRCVRASEVLGRDFRKGTRLGGRTKSSEGLAEGLDAWGTARTSRKCK